MKCFKFFNTIIVTLVPECSVAILTLIKPFINKDYNVCMDSCFTSLRLAMKLLEKRTNLLGLMRTNGRHLNNA